MSDAHNTTTTEAPVTSSEPVTTSTQPVTSTASEAKPLDIANEAPATTETKPVESTPATEETAPATEEAKEESAPAEKVVEPIYQGQLGYKGPGLLKSLIPSKKEFWLSDDSVSPQGMNSFMRGEKPEVANPIVAWASQTGKGLLYFNKKGNTVRKSPESVLPLYEATDLKKTSPHEISFKVHGHDHVLKASSDNERDGWFMSIEKSMELGKAQKDEIRESEGYKAEMEKLNKPHTPAAAAAAKPAKKSSEEKIDEERKASESEEAGKKDKKSRSTSRGLVDRLKGKKEESDAKKEEKKAEKEEKKAEKEDEKEGSHVGEAATAGVVGAGATGAGVAAASSESTEEQKVEPVEKPEEKTEEKPKPAKRGSIFGRISGFGGMKSPLKEKDQKDAELKPEVPAKDEAPQLPTPATETETGPIQPAVQAVDPETPVATESKPEEVKPEEKKSEVATPSKEKPKFLSGLSFMNRGRSVSPSAVKKEEPVKAEPELPEGPVTEPVKVEQPATEPVPTALPETSDKPVEATEEASKEEKTETTPNKRTSVFGGLGRRASKAFKGFQGQKKENTAPKTEEIDATESATHAPAVNGETKTTEAKPEEPNTIGDVVPDAIDSGKPQSQPVAASA